jgi:hypothetical protein
MERVDKLALQDKQLQADIENTQLLIKRLDGAARGICRCSRVFVYVRTFTLPLSARGA